MGPERAGNSTPAEWLGMVNTIRDKSIVSSINALDLYVLTGYH